MNVYETQDDNSSGDELDQLPIISLDNFEEPWAQSSRYVLTSPRSLEACKTFGIKPVDLLQKSLNEFYEEFPHVNRSVVKGIYEREERERKRRLHLVHSERERLSKLWEIAAAENVKFSRMKSNLTEHNEAVDIDLPIEDGIKRSNTMSENQQKLTINKKDYGKYDTNHLNKEPLFFKRELSVGFSKDRSTSKPERSASNNDSKLYISGNGHQAAVSQFEAIERIKARERQKRMEIEKQKREKQERKKQQEIRKKALEQERDKALKCLTHESYRKSKSASMTKSELDREAKLNKIVESVEKELKHLHYKRALDQQMDNWTDIKQTSIQSKHSLANERFMKLQRKRENEIKRRTQEEEAKIRLARKKIEMKEEEERQWKQLTAEQSALNEQRALEKNQEQLKRKKYRIHANLTSKQQQHLARKQQIDHENQKMQRMLEREINAKTIRAKVLQEEKELTAQRRRELSQMDSGFAHMSLKDSNDFHEKALKAELTNNILFNDRKLAYSASFY